MSYLELLWIPAVLGWIPLIYEGELSALVGRLQNQDREPPGPVGDAIAREHADDPIP